MFMFSGSSDSIEKKKGKSHFVSWVWCEGREILLWGCSRRSVIYSQRSAATYTKSFRLMLMLRGIAAGLSFEKRQKWNLQETNFKIGSCISFYFYQKHSSAKNPKEQQWFTKKKTKKNARQIWTLQFSGGGLLSPVQRSRHWTNISLVVRKRAGSFDPYFVNLNAAPLKSGSTKQSVGVYDVVWWWWWGDGGVWSRPRGSTLKRHNADLRSFFKWNSPS